MTDDELRDELRAVRELADQRRRQLGGMTAAHNRAKQRIKELEAENEQLRRLLAGRYDGGGKWET